MEYFLDLMKPYELEFILDNLSYTARNEWELLRSLLVFLGRMFSSKQNIQARDIMLFSWDFTNSDLSGSSNKVVTELDKERIRQKEQQVKDMMKRGLI